MKLTDKQEREFQTSGLHENGERFCALLNGMSFSDALGIGLGVVCTAARSMNVSKIEVQKMLIEMWDAVSQEEIEALQRELEKSAPPAGGNA